MKAAPDRRQTRTRAALQSAFRELLLEQGYAALTVGAVADSANIGRSTFYEHYRTKDDLLRASLSSPFNTLADLVGKPPSADAILRLLRHFRENRQIARVLLKWPTRPVLASSLTELITIRLHALSQSNPLIPIEVIARQIADMQLALVEIWLAGRPAMSLDAVAEAMTAGTAALTGALAGRMR